MVFGRPSVLDRLLKRNEPSHDYTSAGLKAPLCLGREVARRHKSALRSAQRAVLRPWPGELPNPSHSTSRTLASFISFRS